MNGIVYCRVSSKEQVEGTSLESQRQACAEYARSHSITILRTFIEEGESAKFADRTQLAELLTFCREHQKKAGVLLVWKLDRFARNVSDHFSIKAVLLKYGVRVVSVTEPIDANPEGKLLETILAGFAQFDNDIRAVRTVQGMKRKLQEGIWPWHPPLGYEPPTRKGEKKTLPDQPKQPLFGLLQMAWREFATGAYTKAEIRRLMTGWGIVTDMGRSFSPQSIDRLFQNPFYAGVLVDRWSKDRYTGQHQPLVTMEEFERVQAIVRKRSKSRPHAAVHPDLLLRGTVRCPNCHRPLTGGMSRGRSRYYAYYQCRNAACPQRNFAAAPVHAEFEDQLDRTALRKALVPKLMEAILGAVEYRHANQAALHASVTAKRAELDRELQALIRMRASELLTDQEFLTQKEALLTRRMALDGAAAKRQRSAADLKSALDRIIEPLTRLRATWRDFSPETRQRFNRMLVPAGFAIGECRTAQMPLLFSIFGGSAGHISQGVPPTDEMLNRLEAEIIEFSDFVAEVLLPEKLAEHPVQPTSLKPDPGG